MRTNIVFLFISCGFSSTGGQYGYSLLFTEKSKIVSLLKRHGPFLLFSRRSLPLHLSKNLCLYYWRVIAAKSNTSSRKLIVQHQNNKKEFKSPFRYLKEAEIPCIHDNRNYLWFLLYIRGFGFFFCAWNAKVISEVIRRSIGRSDAIIYERRKAAVSFKSIV